MRKGTCLRDRSQLLSRPGRTFSFLERCERTFSFEGCVCVRTCVCVRVCACVSRGGGNLKNRNAHVLLNALCSENTEKFDTDARSSSSNESDAPSSAPPTAADGSADPLREVTPLLPPVASEEVPLLPTRNNSAHSSIFDGGLESERRFRRQAATNGNGCSNVATQVEHTWGEQ